MRTTLELDDRVVAVARAKAAADQTSLGRALSDLVIDGLNAPEPIDSAFPTFGTVPGHIITDDLVSRYQDD